MPVGIISGKLGVSATVLETALVASGVVDTPTLLFTCGVIVKGQVVGVLRLIRRLLLTLGERGTGLIGGEAVVSSISGCETQVVKVSAFAGGFANGEDMAMVRVVTIPVTRWV